MKTPSDPTVIVVGGAGGMGRYATRAIARLGAAGRLLIADKNVEYAERLAAEVGGGAEAVELDVTDDEALRRTFAECDVVCGTLGPFTIFGGPILRAAIESGCDYLDIDDDWQSTVEAFELDELARSYDVTAIVGMGSSPGLSNLMAMFAVEGLDEVDTLLTGWNLAAAVNEMEKDYPATGSASAAVEHWLLQCSGSIRVWEGGAYVEVPPLRRHVLDLPRFGEQTVYTMGHPEPITLPKTIPGLTTSLNLQAGPDWLLEYVRSVAADLDAGRVTLADGAAKLLDPPRPDDWSRKRTGPRLPFDWVLVQGTRDGDPITVMAYPNGEPAGKMGGQTGVPLAIGLDLLRRGKIEAKGVLAPEMAVDHREFFELFADFIEPALADDEPPVVRIEVERPVFQPATAAAG